METKTVFKKTGDHVMENTNARKIYVDHKQHGTCITYRSQVYTAPAGASFDKKADNRITVASSDDCSVTDTDGRVWMLKGFNPGCGARCPADLRDVPTAVFAARHSLSLPEAALAALASDQRPAALMRSTWMLIDNDTRKLCILAQQGKLPERPVLVPEPSAPVITDEELERLTAPEIE